MVPSKTSFSVMSTGGHPGRWLQSILHRGRSFAHVFSINLHFCFASAHPSCLPGDSWGGSVAPQRAQKEALEGRAECLLPSVYPAPPRPHSLSGMEHTKYSAQRNCSTKAADQWFPLCHFVIFVPRKGCCYWSPTK